MTASAPSRLTQCATPGQGHPHVASPGRASVARHPQIASPGQTWVARHPQIASTGRASVARHPQIASPGETWVARHPQIASPGKTWAARHPQIASPGRTWAARHPHVASTRGADAQRQRTPGWRCRKNYSARGSASAAMTSSGSACMACGPATSNQTASSTPLFCCRNSSSVPPSYLSTRWSDSSGTICT
jgi:hypothetical protein